MLGIEGLLAGFGIEHAGVALLLAGLAMHSRKVLKVGGAIGGFMATGAVFMVLLAVLVAAGALEPDVSRVVELGSSFVGFLRWLLRVAGVGV